MLKIKMNKINKITNYNDFIALNLVIIIISNIIVIIINTRLENEVKAYKAYYNASEALFNEIEDYNENLFDSDKAIDYYEARKRLSISKIKFCFLLVRSVKIVLV